VSGGPGAVHRYMLLLPPGWRRIPVGEPEPTIRDILDTTFAGLPADRYGPFRRELHRLLRDQVAAARDASGLDLYLPVDTMRGVPVAASFVVSQLPPGAAPPQDVLTSLALHEGDPQPVQVAGQPGLRVDRVVESDPERQLGADFASRRVHYIVPVPGDGGWLLLAFSAVRADEALPGDAEGEVVTLTDILVDLFDAIVTTLRWSTDG
jgi:hypothetical protein